VIIYSSQSVRNRELSSSSSIVTQSVATSGLKKNLVESSSPGIMRALIFLVELNVVQ
jgi:hypothetical protein